MEAQNGKFSTDINIVDAHSKLPEGKTPLAATVRLGYLCSEERFNKLRAMALINSTTVQALIDVALEAQGY